MHPSATPDSPHPGLTGETPAPARRGRVDDRPIPDWNPLEAVVVAVIALGIGIILAPITHQLITGKSFSLLISIELELITGFTVIAWLTLVHKRGLQSVRLAFNLRDIGAGFLGGVVVNVVALWILGTILLIIIKAITGHSVHPTKQLPGHLDGIQVLLAGLFVVSAAFGEELFFRGLIFRGLRARIGFWASAVTTSVFFGAVHFSGLNGGSYILMGTMFFVGLAFAAIYEWRKNLIANMTSHAVFNLASFLVLISTMSR